MTQRVSHYYGQNDWCTEGWNTIVKDFNGNYPEAIFSKSIQDDEAQLKKITKQSNAFASEASIINISSKIWDEIIYTS